MAAFTDELEVGDEIEPLYSALCPIEKLRAASDQLRVEYEKAKPYPHLVVDGLYDETVLKRILAKFPNRKSPDWVVWDTEHEFKTTSRGITDLPVFTQLFFLIHQTSYFIRILEQITGIDNLLPDPLFHGAGLQEVIKGGWLDIHSDYTRHPTLPLRRRLNVLVYLNRDWNPEWGGDIELWDYDTRQCGAKYAPLFNRTLIFPTTSTTLHGQPSPLCCPEDVSRRFISIYYWSAVSSIGDSAEPIRWYAAKPDTWERNLERMTSAIFETIPKSEKLILVDGGKIFGNGKLLDYAVIPFLEKDGAYYGAPLNDTMAIAEFERVKESNANFLVFAWPAFWWLTYYAGFHRYLRSKFKCILDDECLVIFDLRQPTST